MKNQLEYQKHNPDPFTKVSKIVDAVTNKIPGIASEREKMIEYRAELEAKEKQKNERERYIDG